MMRDWHAGWHDIGSGAVYHDTTSEPTMDLGRADTESESLLYDARLKQWRRRKHLPKDFFQPTEEELTVLSRHPGGQEEAGLLRRGPDRRWRGCEVLMSENTTD
eukprot:14099364-Heterocapsa_arctica.AAC.1